MLDDDVAVGDVLVLFDAGDVWPERLDGECIYIGGAEGHDLDAHEVIVVENNLIHDCRHPFSTHQDGINIKDRMGSVTVARNVHWGIELARDTLDVDDILDQLQFVSGDSSCSVDGRFERGPVTKATGCCYILSIDLSCIEVE